METQDADSSELTSKRIREGLHLKIVISIGAAFFVLVVLALIAIFFLAFY